MVIFKEGEVTLVAYGLRQLLVLGSSSLWLGLLSSQFTLVLLM